MHVYPVLSSKLESRMFGIGGTLVHKAPPWPAPKYLLGVQHLTQNVPHMAAAAPKGANCLFLFLVSLPGYLRN